MRGGGEEGTYERIVSTTTFSLWLSKTESSSCLDARWRRPCAPWERKMSKAVSGMRSGWARVGGGQGGEHTADDVDEGDGPARRDWR